MQQKNLIDIFVIGLLNPASESLTIQVALLLLTTTPLYHSRFALCPQVRKSSCSIQELLSNTTSLFWVSCVVSQMRDNIRHGYTDTHSHTLHTRMIPPSTHLCPHQFLEEVPDPLVVAPLLNAGQQAVVELLVDLVELRHFEEDGFNLGHGEDGLRRCGSRLERLHGLRGINSGHDRCGSCSAVCFCVNFKPMCKSETMTCLFYRTLICICNARPRAPHHV